jgi:hypothetical protein
VSKGRWLLQEGRPAEALAAFDEMLAAFPTSGLAADARYLARIARIDMGLALGDAGAASVDRAGAVREFDLAIGGQYDFALTAARIAKATVLWTGGSQREGDALMADAMKEWHTAQTRAPRAAPGPIEHDVVSIRSFLFTPAGSPLYSDLRLNGHRFPVALPPYALVPAEVMVTARGREASRLTLPQTFPAFDGALFIANDQIDLLDRIITKLGGTRTRTPTAIMQIPNQPVGPSLRILDLWNRYFAARPGHWRGWDLLTSPIIGSVEFLDDERTQALVAVGLGYGGGVLLLTKRDGAWSVTRIVSQWAT